MEKSRNSTFAEWSPVLRSCFSGPDMAVMLLSMDLQN